LLLRKPKRNEGDLGKWRKKRHRGRLFLFLAEMMMAKGFWHPRMFYLGKMKFKVCKK